LYFLYLQYFFLLRQHSIIIANQAYEHFSDECSSVGIDTIENKIHIYFSSEFDKKELYKLIPKDAYSYEYGVVSGEGL